MRELFETRGIVSGTEERRRLEQFRTLGVKLAEDDLGSGHSVERMRALPFDVVRLGRSLLRSVERAPLDVLISVRQLTRLCHSLGKTVVVEGVESGDLVDAVALLGVDAVQGYAIVLTREQNCPPGDAAIFLD